MTDDEPVGEVLGDLRIKPMEDGDFPLAAVIMVKFMDSDGDRGWLLRHTSEIDTVEIIGILTAEGDRMRKQYVEGWEEDADDDE